MVLREVFDLVSMDYTGDAIMRVQSISRAIRTVRGTVVSSLLLVSVALSACVGSPAVHWVEQAEVTWAPNKAIDGCPSSYRYRVIVDENPSLKNHTALEYEVVEAAARVASRDWVSEVRKNAQSIGCGNQGGAEGGLPVLSVKLTSVAVHGGGNTVIMYLMAIPYILPMFVYASWDNPYSVTVSAELEFRHEGRLLWAGEIHAQKTTNTDMRDASNIVYDSRAGELGTPLRLALESLRDKVFWHTVRRNEEMRSGS